MGNLFYLCLQQMLKLQACIKYCEEDNAAAKVSFLSGSYLRLGAGIHAVPARVCAQSLLEQLPQDDPDYMYNMGCLLYQDGKYEEACKKFTSAMQVLGYVPGS